MRAAGNTRTETSRIKSHKTVLWMALTLISFIALIGWHLGISTQPVSRAVTESAKQSVSEDTTVLRRDASINIISTQLDTQGEVSWPVKTEVRVNGQSVQTPQTGTVHKVIQDSNGQTTVDINIQSNSSEGTDTTSFTNIELDSTSEIDVGSNSSQ